jgi:tetratricopeptide (TPR) repeat protein
MRKIFAIIVVTLLAGKVFSQSADEMNKLRIAQALEQAGEYDKALGFYRQLHLLAPDNFVYFDGLRRTYMSLKKYDDAKALLQERLKNEPANVVLMCQLADVYYKAMQSSAMGSSITGQDSAMIVWDEALTIDPKNPNTYRAVAASMADDRAFDNAIEAYRKGESAMNSPTMFVNDIARLYFLNANYRESLHELLKILDVQRTSATVTNIEVGLGVYSSSKEALDQFTDEMKREVADHPDDFEYRQLLAFLFMETKDYSSAYATYKWLDEHSPLTGQAGSSGTQLLQFADRAYNDEAYEAAGDAYKEVSSLSKNNSIVSEAIMGYANSLRALGEKDYAEDDRPCAAEDTLKELNASIAAYERIINEFSNTQYLSAAVFNSAEIRMDYFHDFAGAETLLDGHRDMFGLYHDEEILILIRLYMLEGKFQDALDTALPEITSQQSLRSQLPPQQYSGGTDGVNVLSAPEAHQPQAESFYDRIEYQAALALYYLGMYDSSNYYLKRITSNPMSDAANDAILLSNIITNNRGNPEALREFATASSMVMSNRIPEAAATLEDILKNYSQTLLAENARFDLAAAYCKMGKTADAMKNYSALTEDSTGIFADHAQFRICRIYEETLHEKDKAIAEYENFLERFPNSIYQDKVREILRNLLGENS